jgi:hypothetical protein
LRPFCFIITRPLVRMESKKLNNHAVEPIM